MTVAPPTDQEALRGRCEEKLRSLLREYDTLQPAKNNAGDDQEADERLAAVTAQIELLGELLLIAQDRLDAVYSVILNCEANEPFVIHAYAVLQRYFSGQLRTFDEMICFRQSGVE